MRLMMFNAVELSFQRRPFCANSLSKLLLKPQSFPLSSKSIEDRRGRRPVRGDKSKSFEKIGFWIE